MIKLKATVRQVTGRTTHSLGQIGASGPEEISKLPSAVSVEINAEDVGFLLLRFDADGQFCGDTWHESLEKAKAQARFEFCISSDDWLEEPGHQKKP